MSSIIAHTGAKVITYPLDGQGVQVPSSDDNVILGVGLRNGIPHISILVTIPDYPTDKRTFVILADEEAVLSSGMKYHHYVGSIFSKGLHVFELI